MKNIAVNNRRKPRQQGFTLIEILVALTIGLVILAAIGAAFVNSTNLGRQRENQTELNEPAKIIMRMLQHEVSMAGYVDIFDLGTGGSPQAGSLFVPGNVGLTNLYTRATETAVLSTPLGQFFPGMSPVFGCDGAMASIPNDLVKATAAVTLSCGAASTIAHSLQLTYQASPAVGANTAVSLLPNSGTTGEGNDCLQQDPPSGAVAPRNKFVVNRYYVATNASDGVNELYCAGSGNKTPQPIARGVEEFVLRYQLAQPGVTPPVGESGIAAGSAQAQYVGAANVSDVAVNPIGWANVTGVEVCMVSATAVTGVAATGTAQSQPRRPTCTRTSAGVFDADVARAAGDNRLWKRYTSVISVRNAVFSTPF